MTVSNHMITGAVIVLAIKQPILALPLAFASHFVLDALPHVGDEVSEGDVFKRNKRKAFKVLISVDALASLLLLGLLPLILKDSVSAILLISAMLLAFIPDVGIIYRFFREIRTKKWERPTNWLMKFHLKIEWGEREWGVFVEMGWFVLMLILIKLLS